jgi:hypothetical protein
MNAADVHRIAATPDPRIRARDTACGQPLMGVYWSIDPNLVTCAECRRLRPEPEVEYVDGVLPRPVRRDGPGLYPAFYSGKGGT